MIFINAPTAPHAIHDEVIVKHFTIGTELVGLHSTAKLSHFYDPAGLRLWRD
jgi:hypothetical protein